jgi:hypothetical protein
VDQLVPISSARRIEDGFASCEWEEFVPSSSDTGRLDAIEERKQGVPVKLPVQEFSE